MNDIKRIIEVKNGNKWDITSEIYDPKEVYESLAQDLINKKICACRWITSIKRISNYDGTQTIKVFYDNGVKSTYIVRNH